MLAACLRAPSEELGAHLNEPAASIRRVREMDFAPGHLLRCLFAARANVHGLDREWERHFAVMY